MGKKFLLPALCAEIAAILLWLGAPLAGAIEWKEIKGTHFIAYYEAEGDRDVAHKVLRKAESYYKRIAAHLGYARYGEFWTWEERVKIIIFRDQRSFLENTGQPAWSVAYAARDNYLFDSKAIVTYTQEHDFFEGILPHEISHLILNDFLSPHIPPMWLDEGIAQLQEEASTERKDLLLKVLARKGQHIPFPVLFNVNIRHEPDPAKAMVFYAQSLSAVDFLIKRFGVSSFRRLLRDLRDGKSFEDALKASYAGFIVSTADLEKKWVDHLLRE